MTLAELKTWVSTALDDLNYGYFSETQVTRYINDAQREVQKKLIAAAQNYYMVCKRADLVAEQCEYYLPSDFLKLHRMELVLSGTSPNEEIVTLTPITLNQQDFLPRGPGTPQSYTLIKNKFKLFPVPDSVKTIKLTYSYKVSDLSVSTESPDVPEEYHEMIALLAARTGYLRDDRTTSELDRKILMYETSMKQDSADRVQQTGRRIVTTQLYDDSYLY